MKRLKRTYILCCGKRQAAHQCPPNSGDYRIHCGVCSTEVWGTRENTRSKKVTRGAKVSLVPADM